MPHSLVMMAYYKNKYFTNCKVTSSLYNQFYLKAENKQKVKIIG